MKTTLLLIGFVLLLGIAFVAWKASRFAYESPEYSVVEKDGAFEIRDYPAMTLVSTGMDKQDPGEGGSFMRLFRYISKGNEEEARIAMTTPVFITGGEGGEMSFVVPKKVAVSGAPAPKSDLVEIQSMSGGRIAAYRYSGSWSEAKRKEAREQLAAWIDSRNLETKGDYFSAGYDPPFTPKALRRNEVLVRLAG